MSSNKVLILNLPERKSSQTLKTLIYNFLVEVSEPTDISLSYVGEKANKRRCWVTFANERDALAVCNQLSGTYLLMNKLTIVASQRQLASVSSSVLQ